MESGFGAFEEQMAQHRIAELERQFELEQVSHESLQEAYSQAVQQMLRAEDIGWQKLGGPSGKTGHDLASAKSVAEKLGDFVDSNPLLQRGIETRCSYLFAEPYKIGTDKAETSISAYVRNLINREDNQAAVFGLSALETIEGQRYEAGNAFILFDKTSKKFQQIAFDQIADIIYDPDDSSVIRYVKRVWSADVVGADGQVKTQEWKFWYPASKYKPDNGFLDRIGDTTVDSNKVMVVSRANLKPGYVLGTPDAFAAAPWALAYSAYLRDGTKVLAALAEWAWKVTPKKRNPAERAGAAIRENRGAGGTVVTDMDVTALPRANAVDLNTGRPLAAQAAAALGISVVLLLADPGQSGAYGTAQTLSDPNRRTMQARRELNTEFLLECLRLLGVTDPAITWAKIAPGTDKEEMELTSMAWGTGLFHDDEIRPAIAEIAQITLLHETPPDGFMLPNNSKELASLSADADAQQKADGSNSMANGQGRDSVGVGRKSKTATSSAEKTTAKATSSK